MFRTELNSQKSKEKIQIGAPILSIGSCFADVIGQQLIDAKFDVLKNPFGTIYNPLSIVKLLSASLNSTFPIEEGFIESKGIHYHYDFHSDISALSKKELEQKIDSSFKSASNKIKNCKWLLVTLGSAFVFELKSTGAMVANCHKVPASEFDRRMLPVEEITNAMSKLLVNLKKANPTVEVILTVSPVRHTRDTLQQNSCSKAALRLACDAISSAHPEVTYFPSYEIMMDDLRDYRFYEKDLIHPNETAEDYIWHTFRDTFFDTETNGFVDNWSGLKNAINHRAFHPTSAAHQSFLHSTIKKLEDLEYPVDVSEEIHVLKDQLL